jgi:hypothetical protein
LLRQANPRRQYRDFIKAKKKKRIDAYRAKFDEFLESDPLKARELIDSACSATGERGLRAVLEERLSVELRAGDAGLTPSQRIRCWWSDGPYPGNVGDSFNPWLVEKLTGVPVVRSQPDQNVLLAAGSIARFAAPGSHVWGSGFMSKSERVPDLVNWHAVRGPISREMICGTGQHCPKVFGDPALLTPKLFKPTPNRKGRVCLVLHYSHLKWAKSGDIAIISPIRCGFSDIENFIEDLTSYDYVFSTSLHGLIFANAYGIEARRCIFEERRRRLSGDGMKFLDYWYGVGLQEHEPLVLSGLRNFDVNHFLQHQISFPKISFNREALLDAFPW